MKNLSKNIFIVLMCCFMAASAQENVTITVSNANLGLVKELRQLELKEGIQDFFLEDIPSGIITPSVLIESKRKSFAVLEQNYEYDLINVDKVLNKSLDQQVWLVHPEQGMFAGKLLAASSGNLILLDDEGNLQIIPKSDDLRILLKNYTQRKTPFITKPTLLWKVEAENSAVHEAQLSYLTNGLNWQADYVGKLNKDDSKLTLVAWVTITNHSGKSYENTRLKLMAGDINLLKKGRGPRRQEGVGVMAAEAKASFEEKPFFEYHLYTLQRQTDLKNNQEKQIQLFPETTSPVKKIYRVDSRQADDVQVLVTFKNAQENNLGIPLPEGTIRLYKADDADLEFIGEDKIEHTPKDETIDIRVGNAFDVVSERQVVSTQNPGKRSRQQRIEYTIRNHKDTDIDVEVIERTSIHRATKLVSSNYEPAGKKADQLKFIIPVKSDEEATLEFEYIVTW